MSYINEALKKAQKEKETRQNNYPGVVSTPRDKPMPFSAKALWLGTFLVVSLAFAVYLWLPSRHAETPAGEPERSKVASQPQSTTKASDLYEEARRLHKSGRLQEAMGLYQKSLGLDPNHVDALNNLGVICIHNRKFTAARASFAKAIRLRPDCVDAHYNLACLHALEGALPQSLVHLKKAVSLDQTAKDWARGDADLKNLRGVPEFERIVGRRGE